MYARRRTALLRAGRRIGDLLRFTDRVQLVIDWAFLESSGVPALRSTESIPYPATAPTSTSPAPARLGSRPRLDHERQPHPHRRALPGASHPSWPPLSRGREPEPGAASRCWRRTRDAAIGASRNVGDSRRWLANCSRCPAGARVGGPGSVISRPAGSRVQMRRRWVAALLWRLSRMRSTSAGVPGGCPTTRRTWKRGSTAIGSGWRREGSRSCFTPSSASFRS